MEAIIGMVGVVIGMALQYGIQWHLGKRQRQWALEDRKAQYETAVNDDVRRNRYERLKQKMDIVSEQVGRKSAYLTYLEAQERDYPTINQEEAKELREKIVNSEGVSFAMLSAIGSEELRQLHNQFNWAFYELFQSDWDPDGAAKAGKAEDALTKRMDAMLDETLAVPCKAGKNWGEMG